jgi:hypothetical protein
VMKDAGQKDLLFRHFRTQGWYTVVEVPLLARDASGAQEKLITDVDVLALRPTPDLAWEIVVGDCKTKKSESPANRALWVKSVMGVLGAARGFLLLKRAGTTMEGDHRRFADSLGVTLFDEGEFAAFDRAMLYPSGSRNRHESATDLRAFYEDLRTRFTPLRPLLAFMAGGAWMEADHHNLLRRIIGLVSEARHEVDPSKPEHVALILEAGSIFSVALATCVGRAFHQFGLAVDFPALDEGLKVQLWGGRSNYEMVHSIRDQLRNSNGLPADEDGGVLPEWKRFTQLVRSGMDAPRLMFRVPVLLRQLAMEEIGVVNTTGRRPLVNPMVLKLMVLTSAYFVRATRMPLDLADRINFVLTQLAHDDGVAAPSVVPEPPAGERALHDRAQLPLIPVGPSRRS